MSVTLTAVKKRDGEDISSLLKRFKRKVEASGHLVELRERKYFVKPSMVKRIQKNDILFKRKVEKILEEERLLRAKSRI
jgi:small subunit ribosomal protein S21